MQTREQDKREPVDGALAILSSHARAFAAQKIERTIRDRRLDDGEEVETNGGSYVIRNGVGIVSIVGPIVQYGGWWHDGHCSIQSRVMAALTDPRTSSVVLEVNSPGGVVSGCFGAVRTMREAARQSGKRVFAFAADGAYSAAYAWACVADEIHLPDAGGVGSIGVLSVMFSWSRMNADMGLDVAVIRSGAQKAEGHPDLPLDPAAVAREQTEVDRLAMIFAEYVSESRGRSAEELLALQGATIHGPAAVTERLADSVTTFGAVLAMAEAAGRQRQMQQIAARLGLAATASEADINNEITRREVEAAAKFTTSETKRAEAEAKVDILAGCAADLSVRLGLATTGQRDGRKAYLVAAPSAAASELATAEFALPTPRREPSEGAKGGDAYKTNKGLTVADYTKMSDTQRAQLAESDRATFDKLRAEHKTQQRTAQSAGKGS